MTCDSQDFLAREPTTQTQIKLANGDYVHVDGKSPIAISPSLQLKNGFLIPNFSYKLLSINQLTKELNYTVFMTAHGCDVQDTQTQKIICHGTECG